MTSPASFAPLDLAVRFLVDRVLVDVRGEVDMATAPDLEWLLTSVVDRGSTEIVLDLVGVDFLDSSGVHVIDKTSARLQLVAGALRLRGASASIRRVLVLSNMSDRVKLVPAVSLAGLLGAEQQTGDRSKHVTAVRRAGGTTPPFDLARVASMPADHDVVDAALGMVTALAQATIAGAAGVSVSLARSGVLTTVAATDETIAQMDRDQYATGQGPCLAAAADGHWFHVESLAQEERWPQFVPRARADGIGSILSTPLLADADRPIGALNIYAKAERAFGPPEQELAALFATQASLIVANARADVTAEQAAQRLQTALRVRQVIAQAQGIVMARLGVSSDGAYAALRRAATDADTPLRSEAAAVVASTQGSGVGPVDES